MCNTVADHRKGDVLKDTPKIKAGVLFLGMEGQRITHTGILGC